MTKLHTKISVSDRMKPSDTEIFKFMEESKMAVRLNEDKEIVATVKDGLKRTGGYCPCRLQRIEDTKCICKEFREQIADPDFEGYCHCMLYYKSKN